MASFRYKKCSEAFATGGIDWVTDTVKVGLVKGTYVADESTDEYLSDITATDLIASSPAIANKTATDGILDGDDVTFPNVAAGDTGTALVYYVDTGTDTTSRLIAYVDSATGLPVSSNGGDIKITFSEAATKILTL